jgi:dihydrofolate reductase
MRKVIASNNVTLDGRVDEVRDWALPFDHDEFIKYHTDLVSHSDGLLLGRKTYEFFAAVWPSRSGELADRFNSMAKYVASTTLKDLEWENTHLIEGDVPEAVAKLKQQPGQDLIIYGSDDLMHSLERMDLELVDSAVVPPGEALLTYRSQR